MNTINIPRTAQEESCEGAAFSIPIAKEVHVRVDQLLSSINKLEKTLYPILLQPKNNPSFDVDREKFEFDEISDGSPLFNDLRNLFNKIQTADCCIIHLIRLTNELSDIGDKKFSTPEDSCSYLVPKIITYCMNFSDMVLGNLNYLRNKLSPLIGDIIEKNPPPCGEPVQDSLSQIIREISIIDDRLLASIDIINKIISDFNGVVLGDTQNVAKSA